MVKKSIPDDTISSIVTDSQGNVWFGTWGGICKFDGATWTTYTDTNALLSNEITSITVDLDDTIWASMYENGICCLVRNPLAVNENQTILPETIRIEGNHPNPFNLSTTISFTIPRPERVELSLYSITGQRVRTLLSGEMTAGMHSSVWDGKDDMGNFVSSGIYFSRLTSGKHVTTGKMLLLK